MLFKVKKQEKVEKDRRNKESLYLRGQQTQNMLESLDTYYNTQIELLKSQTKTEKLGKEAME